MLLLVVLVAMSLNLIHFLPCLPNFKILPVMEGVCYANFCDAACPSLYVLSERLPCTGPTVLILVGFTNAGCWKSVVAGLYVCAEGCGQAVARILSLKGIC